MEALPKGEEPMGVRSSMAERPPMVERSSMAEQWPMVARPTLACRPTAARPAALWAPTAVVMLTARAASAWRSRFLAR